MIVPRRVFRDQLQRAFASAGSLVSLHTDITRIGIVEKLQSRTDMLREHLDGILAALPDATILFPTFNYDFLSTGRYRVFEDPSQVGVLNEHARARAPGARTRTPVFNFCAPQGEIPWEPVQNAFGPDSTFGTLHETNATIGLYGAGFGSNTLIHYVEETLPIGYRYLKPFRGRIEEPGAEREFELHYRVRPKGPGPEVVEYDWDRLLDEAMAADVVRAEPLGHGRLLLFRARRLHDYWRDRMGNDEHYLLTPASRERVHDAYRKHGRPLRYEVVEAMSSSGRH